MRTFVLASSLLLLVAAPVRPATIDWVTVGDPDNPSDSTGFGAVSYVYQISKYEITNAQYCEFLNAVDYQVVQDYALYDNNMQLDSTRGGIAIVIANPPGSRFVVRPNMADKPVNNVTWLSAARFANWIQNGQGSASTETGSYELNGSMTYGAYPRTTGKIGLPTNNEWYKAAYYEPGGDTDGYWLNATRSNVFTPVLAACGSSGVITNPGINVINYGLGCDWNGQNGHVTTVGSAGPLSASYYGTYDQAGNVAEFTDTATNGTGLNRILRGGGFDANNFAVRSTSYFSYTTHTAGAYNIGFRLVNPNAPGPPPYPQPQSNLDGSECYVWAANAGWINMVPNRPAAGDGVRVSETHLAGAGWSDSTGWINFGDGTPVDGVRYSNTDGSDAGVNLNGSDLSGLAWSPNVGWINFGWAAADNPDRPRINMVTGLFSGYAWSASIGWITLGTGKMKVLNLAKSDSDGDGISDAWEKLHAGGFNLMNATTDSDGDGISDYQEYLADTDPFSATSRLASNIPSSIVDEEQSPPMLTLFLTWPSSTGRLYTIQTTTDFTDWQDSGYGVISPDSGAQTMRVVQSPATGQRFYRIQSLLPLQP